MAFKLPETPKLAVDIVVNLKGSIVLIKRKFPPLGFALPGGFVDVGETVENAAHRELKEETSLLARDMRLIGVFSEPDRDPRGHVVSIAYVADAEGIPKAKDDAKELHIMTLSEALLTKMVIDHKNILIEAVRSFNAYLRKRGGRI